MDDAGVVHRNYDGSRSAFGDTSVAALAPNPDFVAAFAAQRSADGAVTVMAVSKGLSGNTPATITITGFQNGGTAQVWQLTGSNVITRLADTGLTGNSLNLVLPPQSITLLVVPRGATLPSAPRNMRVTTN
jgi:O-glycosyl hydrolase